MFPLGRVIAVGPTDPGADCAESSVYGVPIGSGGVWSRSPCAAGVASQEPRHVHWREKRYALRHHPTQTLRKRPPHFPSRLVRLGGGGPNPGCDVGKIAEEMLQHLTTLPGATVNVTVEIDAEAPDGVSEEVQRVVTENCQTRASSPTGSKSHNLIWHLLIDVRQSSGSDTETH